VKVFDRLAKAKVSIHGNAASPVGVWQTPTFAPLMIPA
jgi:hypothetical protein